MPRKSSRRTPAQRADEPDRLPGEVPLLDAPAGARRRSRRAPNAPDGDPESLRSRVQDGDARHLHAIISRALHRRVKVHAIETDRTVSDIVDEALTRYLDWRRQLDE